MTNTLDPSTNPMTCDLWIKGGVINFGKNVDTISLWTKVERMIDFNRHQFFGLGESFGIFSHWQWRPLGHDSVRQHGYRHDWAGL